MENLNILVTKETMRALKEQAKKENKKYYDLAQEILAKVTNTPYITFSKKEWKDYEKNNPNRKISLCDNWNNNFNSSI